ncbi:MAG: 50S ribosomal protein L4 [Deltaproteobacteria bacterium]|nr:50S ribosomal protein L4 [Deltaproteobacteria bacterium]
MTTKKTIFDEPFREQTLFDTVRIYRSNKRQGTSKAKTRGEVHGTTAKMYRQKGTGNARHGDYKANIFVGGGLAFPPLPKSWRLGNNKKTRQKALRQALSLRKKEGNLLVVDDFKVTAIKTKPVLEQIKKLQAEKGLFVVDKTDEKLTKSMRNIPFVSLTTADQLNALEVLSFSKLVLTSKALEILEKRLTCE